MDFVYWMFQAKIWVILGFLLIITDIFIGSFFILPIGIAAFIMGALLFAQNNYWFGDYVLLEHWRDIGLYFAILSVLSIAIIRALFQKNNDEKPDINEY